MPNDPILHLLGLSRKAGRLEIGEEPVGAACRARHARLVLLASDAAPNTCRRAAHFGEIGNVLWLELPFSKAELGFVLGRGSCAMLALTDAGLAATLVERLTARDPERYGPAAQQLREKADRVLQRQREQRQHEKNLREGKHKPWAPPPPQNKQAAFKKESPRPPRRAEGARGGTGSPARDGQKRSDARSAERARPLKPTGSGTSATRAKDGSARPGHSPKPGPGGRRLSGKFRHNP